MAGLPGQVPIITRLFYHSENLQSIKVTHAAQKTGAEKTPRFPRKKRIPVLPEWEKQG